MEEQKGRTNSPESPFRERRRGKLPELQKNENKKPHEPKGRELKNDARIRKVTSQRLALKQNLGGKKSVLRRVRGGGETVMKKERGDRGGGKGQAEAGNKKRGSRENKEGRGQRLGPEM